MNGDIAADPTGLPSDPFRDALSAVDLLRRSVADVPLAEVYVEGARGALHHAREAVLRSRLGDAAASAVAVPGAGSAAVSLSRPLCSAALPEGWRDDVRPPRPDLGADLVASDAAREMSRGAYLGGMLAAALADHAWLHLGSGVTWSTDRGGALALVGALSHGRVPSPPGFEATLGALEERVVRMVADLGWRRFRSPRYDGPLDR